MEQEVEIKQVSEREFWVGGDRLYLGEDNIVYVTSVGEVDEKKAIAIEEVFLKLLNVVEGEINLFIDINKAAKHSSEARKVWQELSEHKKFRKIALFGLHPVARVLASFVMGVSKKEDLRFFKTKKEALAWLKE
jgi:hypothetical protein